MLKEATDIKRYIIKTGHTDLRYGIDKLGILLQKDFGLDPMEEGCLFLFCGRKRDRIKGLLFEGNGYLLLSKRLTPGNKFEWPRSVDEAREMTRDDFERLMDGFTVESSMKNYKKLETTTDAQKEAEVSGEPVTAGIPDVIMECQGHGQEGEDKASLNPSDRSELRDELLRILDGLDLEELLPGIMEDDRVKTMESNERHDNIAMTL